MVEAWFRGSHAAWATALRDRSRHRIELVTLPGVHWRWRVQGGPVALADRLPAAIEALGGVDALVATSAVDLSALLGLARHHLAGVPALLYLHENQVTFPTAPGEREDLAYAMATWRSLVAADRVVCNSAFHRDELLDALPGLLTRFPDHRSAHLVDEVRGRTGVVGVGVDVERFRAAATERAARPDRPVRILWNHRWEHDKDPARFVAAVERLVASGRDVEVVVAGSHLPVDRVRADVAPIADRVAHVGTAPEGAYPDLVASCDLAVSTARHEFYGVALAEAMAAGVVPVAPHALAYPELVPPELHAEVLYRDDQGLDHLLRLGVDDVLRRRRLAGHLRAGADRWSVDAAVGALDDELDELVATAWPRRGTGAAGSG